MLCVVCVRVCVCLCVCLCVCVCVVVCMVCVRETNGYYVLTVMGGAKFLTVNK